MSPEVLWLLKSAIEIKLSPDSSAGKIEMVSESTVRLGGAFGGSWRSESRIAEKASG